MQRLFTAVAATDVVGFVFSKDSFLDFLSLYPAMKKTLEKISLLHYKEVMENAAEAMGFELTVPVTQDGDLNPQEIVQQTTTGRKSNSSVTGNKIATLCVNAVFTKN